MLRSPDITVGMRGDWRLEQAMDQAITPPTTNVLVHAARMTRPANMA